MNALEELQEWFDDIKQDLTYDVIDEGLTIINAALSSPIPDDVIKEEVEGHLDITRFGFEIGVKFADQWRKDNLKVK